MSRYVFIFLLGLFTNFIWGQNSGIGLDLTNYWQSQIESIDMNKGAKIQLSNYLGEKFLRLGSSHEDLDIFEPFISRTQELPLRFLIEDQESNEYQEQMTLSSDGDVIIHNLADTTVRNLVVLKDGSVQPQQFNGYSGVISLTAHNFVSFNNPGDDHNFRPSRHLIHHENQLSGTEILVAPLQLPHGAIIRQINAYCLDENMSDSIEVTLWIRTHMNPFVDSKISIGTTTYSTSGIQTLSSAINHKVDNLTNMYYIESSNPDSPIDWPGNSVGISSVVIMYDISQN